MMIRSPDPYRFVLEQAVKAEPGKLWNYSGGSTQLLAAVLQRRTGRPLAEFAEEALFEPLGITQFEWVKMPANGEAAAASGLRLRPRDMAKIGELVLENGVWNGHRIVSEAWIEESTKPLTEAWLAHRYGYQWWIGESKIGGGINMPMVSWVAGWGLGAAGLYDSESQGAAVLNILANYVLPAIRQ
jgi:CubicO group peptidase (beta-lactamase class C family)